MPLLHNTLNTRLSFGDGGWLRRGKQGLSGRLAGWPRCRGETRRDRANENGVLMACREVMSRFEAK